MPLLQTPCYEDSGTSEHDYPDPCDLRALPALVLDLNPAGDCRAVTPTEGLERWGLPDDVLGRHILELLPARSRGAARSRLGSAKNTGTPQVFEYSAETPGGERHFEVHAVVGDHDQSIVVFRDVTETRMLKDAVSKLLAALHSARKQTARALLPVCEWCNRVRDERDEWRDIDKLIKELSVAGTVDSICPDCANRERDMRATYQR